MTILSELKNIYISLGGAAAEVANLTTSAQVLAAILAKLGGSAAGSQTDAKLLNKIAEYAEGLIKPTGTKLIQNNGDVDVTEYASAHVAVPQQEPTGTVYITANGVTSVAGYAEADVNVVSPYEISFAKTIERHYGAGTIISVPNVSLIGRYAFITLNAKGFSFDDLSAITDIEEYAFASVEVNYGNSALNLYGASSLQSIGDYAFSNFRAEDLALPNPVSGFSIGDYCFNGMTLTGAGGIDLQGATYVGEEFMSNSSLTVVIFSTKLQSVANNAFAGANLQVILYTGSQAEWESITNIANAGIVQGVTINYNYTP